MAGTFSHRIGHPPCIRDVAAPVDRDVASVTVRALCMIPAVLCARGRSVMKRQY